MLDTTKLEGHPEILSLVQTLRSNKIIVNEDGRLKVEFILSDEVVALHLLKLMEGL